MTTDVRRRVPGSPSGWWARGRGAALAVALLLIGAVVAWAVSRDEGKGSSVKGVPTAQAEPAEIAGDAEPEVLAGEPAVHVGPFTSEDLEGLVLQPDEGEGLVKDLGYSVSYSGSANLGDVHHWTLVPTEPLEDAGFVEAYSAMFMTPEFPSTFATEGRDLATAVLLFDDPEGARRGLRIFRGTRAEVWEEWGPLTMRGGFGTIGRLGSDNVSVVYPTVGFMGRVGNAIVLVGSQGGSDGVSRRDDPLPVPMVRAITLDLLARARAAMGGAP